VADLQSDFWLDDLDPGDRVIYFPPAQNPNCPGIEHGTVIKVYSSVIFVRFDGSTITEPTTAHTLRRIDG